MPQKDADRVQKDADIGWKAEASLWQFAALCPTGLAGPFTGLAVRLTGLAVRLPGATVGQSGDAPKAVVPPFRPNAATGSFTSVAGGTPACPLDEEDDLVHLTAAARGISDEGVPFNERAAWKTGTIQTIFGAAAAWFEVSARYSGGKLAEMADAKTLWDKLTF